MDLEDDLYRSGTAAELSGVAVERLRSWVRRYGFAPAHRAGKTRFYTREQVDRLKRIRALIDQGHPVSSIVQLTDDQLAERLQTVRRSAGRTPAVGLAGPNLLVLERQQDEVTRIDVQARWANVESLLDDRSGVADLDVLVVQFPVLLAPAVERVRKLVPGARLLCVYQFATATHLDQVRDADLPVLRWPLSWAELEHACATAGGLPLRAGRTAPRRFDDDELIAIAASSSDPNRCPAHLVDLITQLNAFAEFASGCGDASTGGLLYERIGSDASHARAQLEVALEALAEAEGLLVTPN
jgi:DNA-binding transcriptional MerR regulator